MTNQNFLHIRAQGPPLERGYQYGQQAASRIQRNIEIYRELFAHYAGWDWGPCLMVSGIHGGISLRAASPGRIEYVYTAQKLDAGRCVISVYIEYVSTRECELQFSAAVDGAESKKTSALLPGNTIVALEITVADPKLWWPNGHGDQPLYDLTVRAPVYYPRPGSANPGSPAGTLIPAH